MTWFRIDDGFDSHPKVLAIPRGAPRLRAIGLWTSLGVWCAKHLTDGRFARHMVAEHGGTTTDARRLVEVGLWLTTEDGYAFHQWTEHQPPRERVLAEREANADRQRRWREQKAQSQRESRRDKTVSNGSPDPTRPDPTAAAAAEGPRLLPPSVEILRGALAAAKLETRWDLLTDEQLDSIESLVETHGDAALVKSAIASHRPEKPARLAQAWLGQWESLTAPGDLRLVKADPCPTHGLPGTVRHCVGCSADALAAH